MQGESHKICQNTLFEKYNIEYNKTGYYLNFSIDKLHNAKII